MDLCLVAEGAEKQLEAAQEFRRAMRPIRGKPSFTLVPIAPMRLAEKEAIGDLFFGTIVPTRGSPGPLDAARVSCMIPVVRTITIDDEAYKILRRLKQGKSDSFTRVIKRHYQTFDTCGELIDWIESAPPPKINRARLKTFKHSRGLRSNRKY